MHNKNRLANKKKCIPLISLKPFYLYMYVYQWTVGLGPEFAAWFRKIPSKKKTNKSTQ
jgi:hypothetical protein